MEVLVESLGELLRDEPLCDPLQAEILVVQSYGMRRWLSLELARLLGVSMHCAFPYPANFAHEIFCAGGWAAEDESPFDRAFLPWRIDRVLAEAGGAEIFAPLARYAGSGEGSEARRFQLSLQLAELLDRFIAYRPEDLLKWEKEGSGDWKGALWQKLARDGGAMPASPPALLRKLQAYADAGGGPLEGMPSRVSLFGISSLPPFYIHLVREVARVMEVRLYLFEPTNEFWSDIRTEKEQRNAERRMGRNDETDDGAELHFEVGNALLASLGKMGRDFAAEIAELEPEDAPDDFREPEGDSLLQQVQRDIFTLQNPESPAAGGEPAAALEDDFSLQIHCCHSPLRELEVLHDQLLALFDRIPELRPMDIVVMMPDVDRYAHLIDAIFDTPEKPEHRIPFTIADRAVASENKVAHAFARILDFQRSRFPAGEVLSLLELEPVRRRFGIEEADLEKVRDWTDRSGIRWGMDAAHRGECGILCFDQNSWRTGFDRLLLGHAWEPGAERPFDGILPLPCAEGHLAETLGSFVDFGEALFESVARLRQRRTPAEWGRELAAIAERFLDDSEDFALQAKELRGVLQEFDKIELMHPGPVDFNVIRLHLDRALGDTNRGSGFMAGRMTFCSLKPLRSIPFRVVCILGLDDGQFPRRDTEPFAQWLGGVRAGRSRRDEDRQLFLEALLSARDAFYLSYSGLSQKDNSEAPPSAIVSELLDYLARRQGAAPGGALVRHRLHAYSPAYFSGDARLFSYSAENRKAAADTASGAGFRQDWALEAAEPAWRRVTLEELNRFFKNPAVYFLQQRVQIRLPETESALQEMEPMNMSGLEKWQVRERALRQALEGAPLRDLEAELGLTGLLPLGPMGESLTREAFRPLPEMIERMRALTGGAKPERGFLDHRFVPWELIGVLDGLYPAGQMLLTVSVAHAREKLRAWLRHLALQLSAPPGVERTTYLIARDGAFRFTPCENAAAEMDRLLEFYWHGLHAPLPFTPEVSFNYARRTLKKTSGERLDPVANACKEWKTNEADRPEHRLLYADAPPSFDAEWQRVAEQIFGPLLDHLKPL